MKHILIINILLVIFINANSQILLTTSMDCYLTKKANPSSNKVINIPSHSNVIVVDRLNNDYFKVKFNGKTGYLHKIFIAYCDNYYTIINSIDDINKIYIENKYIIDKRNNQKVYEENLFHVTNNNPVTKKKKWYRLFK